MKILNYFSVLILAATATLSGCKKDTKNPEPEVETLAPTAPAYTVPTTYNFSNADFTNATRRIAMLGELTTYMKSAHTTTQATQPVLNAQTLKDMYANVNNLFADAALNTSGIQLKNQTSLAFQPVLDASFDDASAASAVSAANPTITTASSGVKGKIISPSRAILVDDNGFEYKEFAEKGIMGGLFYYQATTILSNIASFDNTTLLDGSTAQEKAWDEAFGYFGVPINFPTNTVGLKNWGSYANSVNAAIGCNATIMDAFLKGRAAISNKDNTARDTARTVVINTWEKMAAAKCINYLKGAKANITDKGTLHHNLSEAYGFVSGFRYNASKTISDSDIAALLGYFGTNLHVITQANIDNAIAKLATVFTLDASKL